MRSIASTTAASKASLSPSPSMSLEAQPQGQRSPWHSPVPYLFGGLAAMLGLIAFALLILACSYWRLAGQLEEREGGRDERDLESGEGKEGENSGSKVVKVYEEKFLVIMAGEEKPTFLATPAFVKAASLGDGNNVKGENREGEKAGNHDTTKKEMGDLNDHSSSEETRESRENPETQDHNQ